jgi:hypothetical protein
VNKSGRIKQRIFNTTEKNPNKMTGTGLYLSLVTENVNGLNSPIIRYRVAE